MILRVRVLGKLHKQQKANSAVRIALLKKELERPEICNLCDTKCKPLAHHPDYDRKLEIIWVCTKCHRKLHSESAKEDRLRRKRILQSTIIRENDKIVA